MYREYFGLREYPFRLAPDLDYLYLSRGHARAKSYLDYALVSNDGFVVITGAVGSGKTTLLHNLLARLPERVRFAHIEHTQLTPTEFLQAVVQRLVGDVDTDNKVELLRYLRLFVEQAHARGMRLVLAIDEAQGLSFEVLEEIRMLAGIAAGKDKPISMVLMGQPELARVIETPRLEQLRQRVRLRFHLEGMTAEETREYVSLRLGVAGAEEEDANGIFTEDAIEPLYEYSGGIPRLINTLCDMALLTAYVDEQPRVDAEVMRTAAAELEWRPYEQRYAAEADTEEPAAPTSMIPASQYARLTDALDRIDANLGRIAGALERQPDARTWESDAS
ncbi:MAG: AAA family ATPase [Halofilum sp. (in: g-proteobacteria)]